LRKKFLAVLFFCFLSSSIQFISVYAVEFDETTNCIKIIDGDTFVTPIGTIQLADVDCPEHYESGYVQTKNALSSLIYNKQIYLDIDDVYRTDYRGTGSRLVCVVYVQTSSTQYLNVNKYLVENSFAIVKNYDNEFSPNAWDLYYVQTFFDITRLIPFLIIGVVGIFGTVIYLRRKRTFETDTIKRVGPLRSGETRLLKINEMKRGMNRVSTEAKIIEKSIPRSVNTKYGPRYIADAIIEDETGTINLPLWEQQIDLVNVGDIVRIKGAYVTEYREETRLNVPRSGTIEVVRKSS
jgi:replication factor A1